MLAFQARIVRCNLKKKEKKIAHRNVEKKSLQYLKYILDSRTDCEKISGEIMRVTRR